MQSDSGPDGPPPDRPTHADATRDAAPLPPMASSLPDPTATPAGPAPARPSAHGGASGTAEASLRRELIALLPDMRAFARFLVRDQGGADDLVQETVVRALAALAQFQPGTSLKAWVFTIERNAFWEQGRRRGREQRALRERFAEEEASGPPQESRTDLSDLNRVLFLLPPLLREALVLVGAQELSHEAAAAICGVPVGTMRARVSRARSRLGEMTGRVAPTPEEP